MNSNFQISLIDRVHKIYNDTTWQDRNEQDGFKGMGFVIKKIVVHSEATTVRGGELHYNMDREKWDVRNLLEVIINNCRKAFMCITFHFDTIRSCKKKFKQCLCQRFRFQVLVNNLNSCTSLYIQNQFEFQ